MMQKFFFAFAALFVALAVAADASTGAPSTLGESLGLNVAGVPQCAVNCAKALPSACNGNPQCICSNSTFMNDIACCVADTCASSDLLLTQQFASQLCNIVGESLPMNPTCPKSIIGGGSALSNWAPQGCYSEATNYNRALNATFYIDTVSMTPGACVKFCTARRYAFAGVEYGQECWCGNNIQFVNGAQKLSDETRCSMPCKGDQSQFCGGPATLNIYQRP